MSTSVRNFNQPAKRYIPKAIKHEESIQMRVCSYLRLQYPHVIFHSDYASGLHLTPAQAAKNKRLQSGRGFPDLFIYHKSGSGRYAGMGLELKRDGETVYLKNGPRKGKLTSDEHIQEQAAVLQGLRDQGYYADFAVGFDQAQYMIDKYMGKLDNVELPFQAFMQRLSSPVNVQSDVFLGSNEHGFHEAPQVFDYKSENISDDDLDYDKLKEDSPDVTAL